jgi:hypothetical protein
MRPCFFVESIWLRVNSIQVVPFPATCHNGCQLIQLLPKQLGAKDFKFFLSRILNR